MLFYSRDDHKRPRPIWSGGCSGSGSGNLSLIHSNPALTSSSCVQGPFSPFLRSEAAPRLKYDFLTFHFLSCSYAIITVLPSHKTAHDISAQAQQYNNRHTTCNRQQCVPKLQCRAHSASTAARSKSPTTRCLNNTKHTQQNTMKHDRNKQVQHNPKHAQH